MSREKLTSGYQLVNSQTILKNEMSGITAIKVFHDSPSLIVETGGIVFRYIAYFKKHPRELNNICGYTTAE